MLMRSWKLSNTYLGIIFPGTMTSAFFIFLLKKAFDDLPNDMMESAHIDGASRLRIYLQIYLPLVGAMLATMVVLNVLDVWNDLLWPMIIINEGYQYRRASPAPGAFSAFRSRAAGY